MEKLKKYNQKLLAVLGTIAVLFLIIGLIGITGILIQEYQRTSYYDRQDDGILSEEKIEELQKENKREQVISYETPKLIDTLQQLYIIPVSQKSLEEAENIDSSGLLNMYSNDSYKKKRDVRYSKGYYGNFNNVIIYDQKTGNTQKLFTERVNFNTIQTVYFEDDIFLLCDVATKDTFKDGVINLEDFTSLYIYSFSSKKLQKVGNDEFTLAGYKFITNSKELIIRFGVDKNSNGKYEEYREPSILKRYNFQTETLTDIIDAKLHNELQQLLEGSVK
jgi:Tfp pilus assembly protein PilV